MKQPPGSIPSEHGHGDAERGAAEQQTKAYAEYGRGVAEAGTKLSAPSFARVAGSASKPGKTMPLFALIDCNNFFASCERVFRPDLKDKPVAVLSNNDGCIIARSNEIKALGIPMAAPYFKHKELLKAHQAQIFSANFALYGNMSQRITTILKQFSPDIEVYSVDESFLEVSTLPIEDYKRWALEVAATVEKHTGISVSVGVAPTKTLAKLAVARSKKDQSLGAGLSLVNKPKLTEDSLRQTPVEDVWGIGWRTAPRLQGMGIKTAYDLIQMPDGWILKNLTIRGLKTIKELRGESCIPLDQTDDPQQSISATRMFGSSLRALNEIEAAIANFATRTAAKLRRNHELTWEVSVYLKRNIPSGHSYIYHKVKLPIPTSDTGEIIKAALAAMQQVYDPDFSYKKAGVILSHLVPESAKQLSVLEPATEPYLKRQDLLMQTVDAINKRYGPAAVHHAREDAGDRRTWHSHRDHQSPAYVTDWYQIPRVRAA